MTVPETHADTIASAIPHREPFLFVTRVLERDEQRIVTEWSVPPEAEFFRGHYPGQPLVPGVLLAESAFQAGAILCARRAEESREESTTCRRSDAHDAADPSRREDARDAILDGGVPVLTRISDARFKRMVGPGETLRCGVVLEHKIGAARYMKAKLTCGDELVLRVEFTVAVTNPSRGRDV